MGARESLARCNRISLLREDSRDQGERPTTDLTQYSQKRQAYSRWAATRRISPDALRLIARGAHKLAGLSYDTKFNLARRLQLPYSDEYFGVPPGVPHRYRPKLGVLHAALVQRAAPLNRSPTRADRPKVLTLQRRLGSVVVLQPRRD
jgi:hypothetical protein